MDRGNILVVAVVTAAVALFVLARFSSSSSDPFADPAGDVVSLGVGAQRGGDAGTARDDAGGGEALREHGRKSAAGAFGERKAGGASREPMRLAKQTGSNGRRGGSVVSIPGKEKGRGTVGLSGSQRRSSAAGSETSIADTGRPSGATDTGSSSTERRSGLVDFLADQPPGVDPLDVGSSDDPDDPDGENGDVVFSAPLDRESGTVANEDTPPLIESDLEYSEDGVGVKFEPGSVLAFPDAGNVRGDAGTMTLEFQPEWSGAEKGDYSLVNVRTPNDPNNSIRIFKNGRYMRFLFSDNTGQERNIGYDMVNWEAGEPHTVTATWDEGVTSLYIDNNLVGTNYYEGQLQIRPGTPLYLGSDVPEAPLSGANATISNFRVYGRALGSDEVSNYQFPTTN